MVLPLLSDTAPRVRFFAAEALGRLKHRAAGPALVDLLAANDDRDVYLRHAASTALAGIGDAASIVALASHPSRGVRLGAVVALRRLRHAGVATFLADRDELVVTEAARAINDDGGIADGQPALARLLDDPRFTSEPLLRRAISANLRGGSAEDVARVRRFAASAGRPDALRIEAVAVLGVWPAPSALNRVDGARGGS
jgi:HEAT repeat protein